jgi:hypothetical protein
MKIALLTSSVLVPAGACFVFLASCSSDGSKENPGTGGGSTGGSAAQAGSSPQAGSSAQAGSGPTGTVGTFSVVLNPAIDESGPYTSVAGKVYGGVYPTDVIETAVAENDVCTVYKFSRHTCASPACTTSQVCTDGNVCTAIPALVSLGEVTLAGIGSSSLKLSAVNNNYQFAGEIDYPGFAAGSDITLNAAGDHYPAFSITTQGVAPIELSKGTYTLSKGTPLTLEWTAEASGTAQVEVELNISKHGGSAGFLKCDVDDSGTLTIPGDLISALIDLGVAGFPQLTVRRSNYAEAQVNSAKIGFEVAALAGPKLEIEGYCSCFNSTECGSCADATKTSCDSVKKLCVAP